MSLPVDAFEELDDGTDSYTRRKRIHSWRSGRISRQVLADETALMRPNPIASSPMPRTPADEPLSLDLGPDRDRPQSISTLLRPRLMSNVEQEASTRKNSFRSLSSVGRNSSVRSQRRPSMNVASNAENWDASVTNGGFGSGSGYTSGFTETRRSSVKDRRGGGAEPAGRMRKSRGFAKFADAFRGRLGARTRVVHPTTAAVTSELRVIFLDIDGVLHSVRAYSHFKDTCMHELKTIVDATGAKVVVSSNWRRNGGLLAMARKKLRQLGIEVIDVTPTNYTLRSRGEEISFWLDMNPKVANWVAIDDSDLLSTRRELAIRLEEHFVQTQGYRGLTHEQTQKAIQILLRKPTPPSSATGC